MYDIGLALRNRYGQFIGNVYNHSKIEARSSYFARTRMSCELVMAAMFQPTLAETWNPKLNWQPTLCDYVSEEEDYIFLSEAKCGLLSLKRVEIEKDRILGKFKQYQDLFRYLSDKSGMNIQTPAGVTPLYDTLRCQNDMNLNLPSWSRSVFPSPMSNLSVLDWDYFAKTDQQKRFAGGVLLETIVDNTNKKINRRPGYTAKQIYIYSGHDSNMVPIMSILNIYPRKIMPYGITIMFEIHRINKKFIVKVYLQDSNVWRPRYMPLPNCAKYCTLKKFINTYKKYFGTKEMCSHT
ncbi:acid phosphatase-related [Holotrichia oblita]|uniref:Acid phosphatase-related n=1 Tax=Holotrichia oblita TaxID=644536 RepID=A0ACB9SYA4_HOLOL|nr:acid phosphatase-related [Holotrichia oblita]